jgi:prevent-host-death family protein
MSANVLHDVAHEAAMTKQISLREANQNFAKYVRAVEAGESFTITRRGEPVARLTPAAGPRRLTPRQEAALARTAERMRRGWPLGGGKLDREALYEEMLGRKR